MLERLRAARLENSTSDNLSGKIMVFSILLWVCFAAVIIAGGMSLHLGRIHGLAGLLETLYRGLSLVSVIAGLVLLFSLMFIVPLVSLKTGLVSAAGFISIFVMLFLMMSPVIMVCSIHYSPGGSRVYPLLFILLAAGMSLFYLKLIFSPGWRHNGKRSTSVVVLFAYLVLCSSGIVILTHAAINYFQDSPDSIVVKIITMLAVIVHLVIFLLLPAIILMVRK